MYKVIDNISGQIYECANRFSLDKAIENVLDDYYRAGIDYSYTPTEEKNVWEIIRR